MQGGAKDDSDVDGDSPKYDMKVQKAMRMNSVGEELIERLQTPRQGIPQRMTVSLHRDRLDGTLGIDLDQFAGLPTVAIVVPGGPADRLGAIRPGDVVEAVNGVQCANVADVLNVLASEEVAAMTQVQMVLVRVILQYGMYWHLVRKARIAVPHGVEVCIFGR